VLRVRLMRRPGIGARPTLFSSCTFCRARPGIFALEAGYERGGENGSIGARGGGLVRGGASWGQVWGLRGEGLTMSSPNRWLFCVAPALLALAAFGGSTDPASAQGTVRSVHNDWQIRCDTPPGAQGEQCALIQSVTAEDRANVGLTVIVLKTAD